MRRVAPALLAVLAACATAADDAPGDSAPASTVDCATAPDDVTWDAFAHGFMITYCTSCHSVNNTDNRYDAPEEVNFDTEKDVYDHAARVRVRVLDDQTMPISGGVYPEDLHLLDVYLTCELGR